MRSVPQKIAGGRVLRVQQRAACYVAAVRGGVAVADQRAVRIDAGLAQRTVVALEPPLGSDALGIEVDESDPAVAGIDQPAGRDVAACNLVGNDRRQAAGLVEAVHENGGHAGQAGRRVERAVLAGRADEPLDPVLEHHLHRLLVQSGVTVDARDQQGLPLHPGTVLRAADDPGTEGCGDNVGDQSDQARALRRERARTGIGAVAESSHRLQDPRAGLLRDVRRSTLAQDERDRGARDARVAGDVRHRHAPPLCGHRAVPSRIRSRALVTRVTRCDGRYKPHECRVNSASRIRHTMKLSSRRIRAGPHRPLRPAHSSDRASRPDRFAQVAA